jgi:hypothetical protein
MDVRKNLENDTTIPDSELLYRGVHPNHIKPDGEISSAAFAPSGERHISVDLASLSTPEGSLRRRATAAGLVKLLTGEVRAFTPGVARDPIEGTNPAHALIIHDFSLTRAGRKEKSRKLAKIAVWAIAPSASA